MGDFNITNSLYLRPILHEECLSIISNLINEVPAEMYKTIKNVFAYQICSLINESFLTGVFPDSLKYANINPILKSDNYQEVSNYRPRSVLSTVSKILEKSITNRPLKFIHKYYIISEKQFGFLKNRSTVDAISNLIEHIYFALNNIPSVFF